MSEVQFLTSKFVRKGKTKLVRINESSLVPVEIVFWKEVWIKDAKDLNGHVRSYYAEIRYRDNHVLISEHTIHDLLHKAGRVLLTLTKGTFTQEVIEW